MAESVGFKPMRSSDSNAAAHQTDEPAGGAQASRQRLAGGLLHPPLVRLPSEIARRTGSPSPGGERLHQLQRLRPSGAPTAAVRPSARPSVVPARPVQDVLRGSGQPLTAGLREEMQARLGTDFSQVRVHTDSAARASAADVGARAYTSGSHIVIGDGGADKRTLAHELTHVIQQRQGPVPGADHGDGFRVSDPSDTYEKAAEANAARVMQIPLSRHPQAAAQTSNQPTPAAEETVSADRQITTPATPALAAAPIQRYTIDKGGNTERRWRISQNRKMAVPDGGETKDFYATADVIASANSALLAKKSAVVLQQNGAAPPDLGIPDLFKVEPVMVLTVFECIEVASQITGNKIDHNIFRPEEGKASSRRFNAYSDAYPYPHLLTQEGATPATLTRQLADDATYRFVWTPTKGEKVTIDSSEEGEAVEELTKAGMKPAAATALLKVIEKKVPRPAEQQLVIDRAQAEGILEDENKFKETGGKYGTDRIKQIAELVEGDIKQGKLSGSYGNMDASSTLKMERKFGVNTRAKPEVGEAYAIYSTIESKGKWNFHFAAVVARDGDDAVTLENYNRAGSTLSAEESRNAEKKFIESYYFAMYGSGEGQSFHDTWKIQVNEPALTLVMGDKVDDSTS